MTVIKCAIEGCNEVFETHEPTAPDIRFICREHPREAQVIAIGQRYDPDLDERDKDICFQDFAFDDDNLNRHMHFADGMLDPEDDPADAPGTPETPDALKT